MQVNGGFMRKIFNTTVLLILLWPLAGCSSDTHPKVTEEQVAKDLIGRSISIGTTGWRFGTDEPIDVEISDTQNNPKNIDGKFVEAHIKTEGRWSHLKMGGSIRLEYIWFNNTWELSQISNLSFKPLDNINTTLQKDGYQQDTNSSNSENK